MSLIVQHKAVVPHPGHWIIRHPETGFEVRHPELTICYKDMRVYCAGNKKPVPTMATMDEWICQQQPQQCAEGNIPFATEHLSSEEIINLLPQITDPTLLGNRIAAITTALGIPPCSGCGARQAWLNKAHQWLREQMAKL